MLCVMCLMLLSGKFKGFIIQNVIVFLDSFTLKLWLNKIIVSMQLNQRAEFVCGL